MNPHGGDKAKLEEKVLESLDRWKSYNNPQYCNLHLSHLACLLHAVGYKIKRLDSIKPEHVPRFSKNVMGTSVVVTCGHSGTRCFFELPEKRDQCKCYSRLKPPKDAKTAEQRKQIVESGYDVIPPMTKTLQELIRGMLKILCELLEGDKVAIQSTAEIDVPTTPPKRNKLVINLQPKYGPPTSTLTPITPSPSEPSTSKLPSAERKSTGTKKKVPVEKKSPMGTMPTIKIESPSTSRELPGEYIEEQSTSSKMPPIDQKSPTRDTVSNQLLSQTLPFGSHSSPSNLNAYSRGYGERSPRSRDTVNREKAIRLLEKAISVLKNYKEVTPEEESFKFASEPDIYPKSPVAEESAPIYAPALRPSFPPKHTGYRGITGKKIELKKSATGSRLPSAVTPKPLKKPEQE